MKKLWQKIDWIAGTVLGSAAFALGFALFLDPNDINTGGVSGLAMVLRQLLGFGSVGTLTMLINIPLFLVGGAKIGKKFFRGVFYRHGAQLCADRCVRHDPLAGSGAPGQRPLWRCARGAGAGACACGGASTGGSDILVAC